MLFRGRERSPPPLTETDPEESVYDFRVSIIEGVVACLEFNWMAPSRPNSEPVLGDTALQNGEPGNTLLSMAPGLSCTATID